MNSMKQTLIASVVTATFSLAGGAALAEGKAQSKTTPTAGSMQQGSGSVAQNRDVRAKEIIGAEVKNTEGRKLGEIEDLVMDTSTQHIRYAILSHGGFMDVGDKLFAYPVSAFRLADKGRELVLNVPKERLEKAPGFDKDAWPDFNEAKYRDSVDRHFGSPPTEGAQKLARVSDVLGGNLNDRSGRSAGEVKDLVFNLSDARVRYAVVEFDDAWRNGERTSQTRAGSEASTMARAPRTDRDTSTIDRSPAVSTTTGTADTTASTGTPGTTTSGTTAAPGTTASPTTPAPPATTAQADNKATREGRQTGDLHAVPPSALQWSAKGDADEIVLNMEPSQVQGRQGFDEEQLEKLNDPSFKQRVQQQIGNAGRTQ